MGVWSFWAGFGQGGHVLEPTSKGWPHAQNLEGRRKKNSKKWAQSLIRRRARAGLRPMVACRPWINAWPLSDFVPIFEKKFVKLYPHFLKLAPTFGSIKCSIPHGDWRFHFLSNLIFPKFRIHMDLHIYRWDFCFKKSKIKKELTIFASIMEMFCTLLQCRVHLSMFHSSSTSKIWHTST
jgi:hypothetical protein